jgi:Protein of unknown function (DUF3300)
MELAMTKAPIRILVAALLYFLSVPSFAQTGRSVPASTSEQGLLTGPQLEALVSPIALYPDSLLSNVLMASTYPLEIVQADRWLNRNKNLTGDAMKGEIDKQSWDESVKGLIATPPVLAMMNSEVDWTQRLGDAVLAQQADVMAAIQRLRLRAQDNGKLTTNAEQTVTIEQQAPENVAGEQHSNNNRTVVIGQANDDTVYVPAYDPAVVYGAWPYAEYPADYWGYPDYWGFGIAPGVLARGVWLGAGFAVGRWASGNWGWGGRVNWGNGNIIRNWPRATPYNLANINNIGSRMGNTWQHNPAHRQGVRYNNPNVQQRFGNASRGNGVQRGNLGNLGAGAAGLAAGATAIRGAQRTNAATRQGQRHNAANRQGQRHNVANRQGQRHNVANRASSNRSASKRAGTGNRASASRSGSRSAANHGAGRVASRAAGRAPGRGIYNSVGGARGMGGFRGGGGGGFRGGGFRGGGRRSDFRLKHDIVELGRLPDGIGLYRFVYNGGHTTYVGVIAQEAQKVLPAAVTRGADGYLRVRYDKLGLKFQTYRQWSQNGGHASLAR